MNRVGVVALLIVLAALMAFLLTPLELGAIRLAGVGLAWWYGGAVGELLALAITLVFFRAPRAR
jgi:hypothetical protein